jgi:hypothetical protein
MFPSVAGSADDEDCSSSDAEVDDQEEDRLWLTGIKSWAEGASVVGDDEPLLNDGQIEEDSREQPRVTTSLDSNKPDYLSGSRPKPGRKGRAAT